MISLSEMTILINAIKLSNEPLTVSEKVAEILHIDPNNEKAISLKQNI